MFFPLAMLSQYVFGPALFVLSLFIVLIILLQRGRGGGLTGALGGAGGASAFGVKAGDIFTRITAVAVLLWIVLCALTCFWYLPSSLDITANSSSSPDSSLRGLDGLDALTPDLAPAIPSEADAKPATLPTEPPPATGTLPPAVEPAVTPTPELPPATDPAKPAAELPPATVPAPEAPKPSPEPASTEPAKAVPASTEPDKAVPASTEPASTEPASPEPASTEPKP